MNTKLKTITLILSVMIFTVLIGCSNKQEEEKLKENELLNQTVPINITVVEQKSISEDKIYSGSLEGIDQADIVAKIAERIVKIDKKVDDYVNKGETVIELDITGPQSQFLQAQANFVNAGKNLKRMQALLDAGAVSQQQLDQSQTVYDIAKANFEAAKSTVVLTSPISGIITNINVNEGDWVNPGMDMATIAKIDRMIIKFYINENETQDIHLGDKVKVWSESNPDVKISGTITEIAKSASSDSRTFQVKAEFPNTQNKWFKPGMFVKVNVTLATRKDVVAVPNESIMHMNDKELVYVVKNNKPVEKEIKTGMSNGNFVEVLNGVSAGDSLITAGMDNITANSILKITNK